MVRLLCLYVVSVGVGISFFHAGTLEAQLIETLDPWPVPFQPDTITIGHYQNPGQAVGDLPGAIFFHFQLFHVGPQNVAKLQGAIDAEYQRMNPGDSRLLNVYSGIVGGALVFRFLADVESPQLLPADVFVVGQIKVEKPDKVFMMPVSPVPQAALQHCINAELCSDSMDMLDHAFVASHLNTIRGTTNGPALVSIADKTTKSGATGKVILRADEVSGQYQVYNVATGAAETYPKGAAIRARKSTVWILVQRDGREYTVVYNRLENIESSVTPGAMIDAGQNIGKYSDQQDSGVEIWRVSGPQQYFLGNGAYRIAPVR